MHRTFTDLSQGHKKGKYAKNHIYKSKNATNEETEKETEFPNQFQMGKKKKKA